MNSTNATCVTSGSGKSGTSSTNDTMSTSGTASTNVLWYKYGSTVVQVIPVVLGYKYHY